jgi:biotin operon repressor
MVNDITYEDIRPPYCYFIFDDEISDDLKITMLRIMRRVNEDKAVSIPIIAEELRTDPFSIKRHLDQLEEHGLDFRIDPDEIGSRLYGGFRQILIIQSLFDLLQPLMNCKLYELKLTLLF